MMATGFRSKVAGLTVVALLALTMGGVAAAQEQGRSLDDLLAVGDPAGVSVLLAGDGPFAGQLFTLENPPRVVLDLPGVVSRVSQRVHAVEQAGVYRVRVAQFQVSPEPVARIVVDLEQDLPYHLETTARGAILRVGPEPAEQAEVQAASLPQPFAEEQPGETVDPIAALPVFAEAAEESGAQDVAATTPAVVVASAAGDTEVPVTIVDEPWTGEETAEAAVEAARETPPVQPAPSTVPAALTAPPGGSTAPAEATETADSPWTSTPRAMVEQAPPPADLPTNEREVESEVTHFSGEPISLELKDADIKDVLRMFAKITGLNVVVDPDVRGSVTVNLENVPWDQCLDIILTINRLDYVVENNVLRVARMETLTAEKRAKAAYLEQFEVTKPMRTITKLLSYAKAAEVRQVLTSQGFILSSRGTVVIDARTNQLIIRDTVDRIDGILNLIDQLDTPNPQVMIEARIVETTRTFSRSLGVAWGFTSLGDTEHGTNTGWQFPYSYDVTGGVDLATPGNGIIALTFGDILDSFNLDFTLSAAEANGLAKIVSSPKVVAQNNQRAQIQSGIMIPIQTVANNTVTVQYINATLQLNVTPQITAQGTVLLDINIQKREPLSGINLQSGQNAPISTRDAQTSVMVRDGGTTVIGGIYQLNDQDNVNAVPGLSKIPILGALFRNKTISNKHDELLIFITPRIVKY